MLTGSEEWGSRCTEGRGGIEVHTAIYQGVSSPTLDLMAPGPSIAATLAISGQSLRILADESLGLGLGGIYPSSKNRRPQFLTRFSPIHNTTREQVYRPYSEIYFQTQRPWTNNRRNWTLTNSPTTTSEICSSPSTTRCRNLRFKNVRLSLFSSSPSPLPHFSPHAHLLGNPLSSAFSHFSMPRPKISQLYLGTEALTTQFTYF